MNDKREIFGWTMYDWANSAFSTTVITVLLGPYLTAVAQAAADKTGGELNIFVAHINPGSYYPYLISLSVLLQVFFLPLMGAIADYTNLKKQLLLGFAYLGAFATIGMYFLQGDRYLLGGFLLILANLSFGAAIVFYNAYLPDIVSEGRRDSVSSQGFALGYLGGGLLLLVNLWMVQSADKLGLSTAMAVRISLASAGIWWAIFTLVPAFTLKTRAAARPLPPGQNVFTVGINQLRHTISDIRNYPATLAFLAAYLIYNDGIQTVISLSAVYGAEELHLEQATLITTILIVQFVAFIGAFTFSFIASRLGAKRAIIISLIIWTIAILFSFGPLGRSMSIGGLIIPAVPAEMGFLILGAVIAIVLGGSQALSRSLFAQMIPKGRESEFFGFYEISERGTSWIGPLVFGFILDVTGSYRSGILALMVFFVAGIFLLQRVDIRRAIIEAGNDPTDVVL